MLDNTADVRQGFIRQRRNLIAVSLALVFYQTAGLVITRLSFLGNEADVSEPSLASAVLWVAWLYFLLRYFQYFMDVPNRGERDAYYDRLQVLVHALARQDAIETHVEQQKWHEVRNLAIEMEKIDTLHRHSNGWQVRVNGVIVGNTERANKSQQMNQYETLIWGKEFQRSKVKAVLYVVCCTRFATEYYLPFAIAAVPIVIQAFVFSRLLWLAFGDSV